MASHVDTQVINTIMGQPYGSCRLPHSWLAGHETIMYKQHSWAIPNHSHSLQKRVRRSTAEDKTSWNSIFQADFGLARSAEILFQGVDLCSDSINLIDLRVLHPDLRSTVYPDGGQPTGRSKSCHDLCITITETRSRNQPTTLTCATDLIDPHLNRSTYLICISSNLLPHSEGSDTTVGTHGTLH